MVLLLWAVSLWRMDRELVRNRSIQTFVSSKYTAALFLVPIEQVFETGTRLLELIARQCKVPWELVECSE